MLVQTSREQRANRLALIEVSHLALAMVFPTPGYRVMNRRTPRGSLVGDERGQEPDEQRRARIEEFAVTQLRELGLWEDGWRFRWDSAVSRYGCCFHQELMITVSWPIAQLNPFEQSKDVVLHEIAHAVAGPDAKHGPEWKEWCVLLGARPERCYDSSKVRTPPRRYVYACPQCGTRRERHRRTLSNHACGRCCNEHNDGAFDKRFRFVIVEDRGR